MSIFVWYCVETMKNLRISFSALASVLAVVALTAGVVPAAVADDSATVVTSMRSFPKVDASRVDLLVESAAVSVDNDAAWGGVEDLNVPQTQSQAEKDAAAQAAAAEQNRQASSAAATRQQSASRSSQRSAASTGTTTTNATTKTNSGASSDGKSTTSSSQSVVASGSAAAVVAYALQFQGVPYVYGGTTPSGWDCSGFTSYVFAHFGVTLPHSSEGQRGAGIKVSDPQPGDLMWKPGHVGIYIGNGKMIHASTPRTGTLVASTSWYSGWEYYRLIG